MPEKILRHILFQMVIPFDRTGGIIVMIIKRQLKYGRAMALSLYQNQVEDLAFTA